MMQYSRFVKILNHSILVHNLPGYICESNKSTLIFNKSENENIRFRKLKLKFANPACNQKFFQKKMTNQSETKKLGRSVYNGFFNCQCWSIAACHFRIQFFFSKHPLKCSVHKVYDKRVAANASIFFLLKSIAMHAIYPLLYCFCF